MYTLDYSFGWDEHFKKMDPPTQERIWKKIQKQKEQTKTRHLKQGVEFFVAECGQYRIAIKIKEQQKTKEICFAGTHKQYEKWYRSFMQ